MKKINLFTWLFILVFHLELVSQNVIVQECKPQVKVALISKDPCNYNQYVLAFSEEFNDNSLNRLKWKLPYQGCESDFKFDKGKQWYLNTGHNPYIPESNNIEVSNGTLKIIAKKEVPAISGSYWDWSLGSGPSAWVTNNFTYSSASISTKKRFGYGKYEIRCKIPKGKGFWPAFWLYQGDPGWNEIDVFEFWNEYTRGNFDATKTVSTVKQSIHHDMLGDKYVEYCTENYKGVDYSTGFHTFALEWNSYKMEWFIDGVLVRRRTKFVNILGQQVDCRSLKLFQTHLRMRAYPDQEFMNIIVNLSIQSSAEAPDGNTKLPGVFEIDYVRFYKREPCKGNVSYQNINQTNFSWWKHNFVTGKNIIFYSNFIVPYGNQLNSRASNTIILKPGFEAKHGSDFHAVIDLKSCPSVSRSSIIDSTVIINTKDSIIKHDEKISTESINKFEIYPNPVVGKLIIISSSKVYNIEIFDSKGNLVFSQLNVRNNWTEIDLKGKNPAGLYYVKFYDIELKKYIFRKIVLL